jgi:hypothetical protein
MNQRQTIQIPQEIPSHLAVKDPEADRPRAATLLYQPRARANEKEARGCSLCNFSSNFSLIFNKFFVGHRV